MLLAALAGALLAWLSYRGRLHEPIGRVSALSRWIGLTTLLLLLLDPGFVGRSLGKKPLVLLDRSLSMNASGERAAEAAKLAATLGDTVSFGELAKGLAGGDSHLADVLTASVSGGRQIVVVTDGEIPDASIIPPDLLSQITVHTLPRKPERDIAITNVQAPTSLVSGDTLTIQIEASRTPDAPDSVQIELQDGASVLASQKIRFHGAATIQQEMSTRISATAKGDRWLNVAIVGTTDAEPGDDIRWLHVSIVPTPGVIVVNATPDWDGNALYRAMKDVANAPVSGYVQLQAGRWRRMSDMKEVRAADVMAAAKAADLLAVHGDVGQWRGMGHSRLFWPPAEDAGDWYVTGKPGSPVSSAFFGMNDDSLPPGLAARAIDVSATTGWIGAVAKRSRRGAEIPVVGGREGVEGRTVWFGLDGWSRWAMRGGASGEAWRTLVANATSWLLAGRAADSAVARPINNVAQQGRPLRFRWIANAVAATQAIALEGPKGKQVDSLRFDGSGEARLALDVGRYQYQISGGGSGSVAVEPFSDEFVPAPMSLTDRSATSTPAAPRRSWRDILWLFALAVAAFGTEWMLRRKSGAV